MKSGFDLEGYIYESIRNKKKDIQKHDQTKLKAYILHPGDYVIGYKEFKKGKEYNDFPVLVIKVITSPLLNTILP